jgi:type I restriction enzyme M protein
MDASKLGETVKEGKNQKTVLKYDEEELVIETFNRHEQVDDFSVVVSYDQIKNKNYSLSAGQYFEIKLMHSEISSKEFNNRIIDSQKKLDEMFSQSHDLEVEIRSQLRALIYE